MNINEFNELDLLKQLDYINSRLLNESMRSISIGLEVHKNTIPSLLTKNGYRYDKEIKQYVLVSKLVEELVNNPILDQRPTFTIPTKIKKKTNTKAFNIVTKVSLSDKLDEIAVSKHYSRNELINYILEFFVDNMD